MVQCAETRITAETGSFNGFWYCHPFKESRCVVNNWECHDDDDIIPRLDIESVSEEGLTYRNVSLHCQCLKRKYIHEYLYIQESCIINVVIFPVP